MGSRGTWWRERVLSITIGALASSQQEAAKSYTDNSKPHENQRPGHLKLFIDAIDASHLICDSIKIISYDAAIEPKVHIVYNANHYSEITTNTRFCK